MDQITTPKSKFDIGRLQRTRKFARKPGQKSERSSSKKSFDSSVKQMYIKSPTSIKKQKGNQSDFFTLLAQQLISKAPQTTKKQPLNVRYPQRNTQRVGGSPVSDYKSRFYDQQQRTAGNKNYHVRISTLQAQIQLKNHEISIISGQVQRLKAQNQQQKQRRKKMQNEKKELSKQLKQVSKTIDNLKIQNRKFQKQKQHLMKQIQFLQRINYDEKTRSLQSYRQRYLETQLDKAKKQLHRSRGDKQQQLQIQLRILKQQKFTIQSHYKAMKVANQCLIKQINNTQQNFHDIVMNSEQYKKLRDKYIRFLEQYKQLRNQYWSLKAESNDRNLAHDSSSLFSITASEVEQDLTLLRNQSEKSNLTLSQANHNNGNTTQSKNIKAPKSNITQSVKQKQKDKKKKQFSQPSYANYLKVDRN